MALTQYLSDCCGALPLEGVQLVSNGNETEHIGICSSCRKWATFTAELVLEDENNEKIK